MIDISRADLRQYNGARLDFRDDASNHDLSIPRNRVRLELITYLEREFNPGLNRVLAREAALARDDEDYLHRQAIDLLRTIVLTTKGGKTGIDAVALRSLHPALAARVAREALTSQAHGHFVGFDHVERVLELAEAPDGTALDLPGQRAAREAGVIVLGPPAPRIRRNREAIANSFRIPLSIPGAVTLDNQEWMVSADRLESFDRPGGFGPARGIEVVIAADPVSLPLAIRSRRQRRSVSASASRIGRSCRIFSWIVKFLEKSGIHLVVDGDDRIVWVVGQWPRIFGSLSPREA